MRTIVYRGELNCIRVADVDFPRGKRVLVSHQWFECYGPEFGRFPAGDFRVHESLWTDVEPGIVAYRTEGAPLDVAAIIPQFQTPELTRRAVASFKRFYPHVPLLIVDDGSRDSSQATVKAMCQEFPDTSAVLLQRNVGHGAALHAAIAQVEKGAFFTLDSDCVVEGGGFLEQMENRLREAGLYAIGVLYQRDYVDPVWKGYLSCVASLYDTATYRTLPPFIHGPHPMSENMFEAERRGLTVECFPIFDYVWHREAQTTTRFGGWDLTRRPRLAIYGNSYISEICARALVEAGYHVVGYLPNEKPPTVGGLMPVPEITPDTPHDLKLSIQYDRKIALDDRPGYNLHTGLLPEYGGCDILYHTLKNGARRQGLTFHQMTDRFDQGPIISTISYPVLVGDTMVTLYRRMARLASGFVVGCMGLLDEIENPAACEVTPPTLYHRGKVDPEDVELYRLTPEELRQAFGR